MTIRKPTQAMPAFLTSLLVLMGLIPTVSGQINLPPSIPDTDQATLVILAPEGPILADLHISVAKLPYRTWVGRYLATQMDLNKDNRLDKTELGLLTDNMRLLARIAGPDDVLKSMTGEQSATDVSAKDFAEWFRQRLPKTFELIAQPQTSDDAVRLAALIDTDHNGKISDEELLAVFRTLRFRDLDNDETFSVSELLPYRDPRSQNAPVAPDVVNLPFFHVTDDESQTLAADRILQRYGHDSRVASSVLRQGSHGAEEDRPLDVNQVRAILAAPEFHVTLNVRLSDKANASDLEVTVSPSAVAFCRISKERPGEILLIFDGLPLKVIARGGGANNRVVTRGFLGQSFAMLDGDRNQYLDETEFAGISGALQQAGATGNFAAVDQNGDKMVTREELFSYAQRDQMSSASKIEVSVRQEGKTLFGLLDINQDRRLSPREVRSGTRVLKKYDLNGDGFFAETELGTEYVLTLGLGRSELRRSTGAMQMMSSTRMGQGDALLPGVTGLSGPEWFRRMDRNQDGDVSPREFLGSPEHFRLIDTDQDQLISAAEAEAVQ
jgi:Ca2+-binding EF-hand superfamily protein